ncbi:MAG: caspase family protein [Deltaproteobacteria bacterium]|nr:MAG: caspase family protein [Deltaproteobacteria bacterium]
MRSAKTICAAALLAALPALAEARRFALVVGDTKGGAGTRPLRYAERDARRMHAILTRLGGVRPEDARLLTAATAEEVRSALGDLAARADQARARGDETVLLVYYSGHAKDGDLRLGDTRMPLVELRDALRNAPADVRIGLLDSCQSGAITRAKGVRAAPAFDVQQAQAASTRPRGLVLIASSSADEESQESDEIGASFFTHYLASGLLGDADASGDGKVTLAEAYAYAYARTVGETAETRAGAQHPVYLYDLGGAGDVVLTELAPARGAMVFPVSAEGVYVVLDGSRRAIAEVAKARGDQRRLALAPGDYLVKKRDGDSLLVGSFSLADGPVEVADGRLSRRPLSDDPQKGASGPRWSVLGAGGGQFFFDSAARNGLFPPAVLAGAELGVRDDLGHDLAWAVDLAVGGGAATLKLPGTTPIPERFFELTGGASLWRDFAVGDSWTVSVGARVAFLYLGRTFDNHPELPSQNFFTLTPGLTTAVSWRFAERWSAVARGRLNYLFYNVDKAQNLGYAELALGVDYALGW